MTINEFIEQLNKLGLSGNEELRISAFGGMRHGKSVKGVSKGFDWDMGAVIIHPEQALTTCVPPKEKEPSP